MKTRWCAGVSDSYTIAFFCTVNTSSLCLKMSSRQWVTNSLMMSRYIDESSRNPLIKSWKAMVPCHPYLKTTFLNNCTDKFILRLGAISSLREPPKRNIDVTFRYLESQKNPHPADQEFQKHRRDFICLAPPQEGSTWLDKAFYFVYQRSLMVNPTSNCKSDDLRLIAWCFHSGGFGLIDT